MFEEFAYLYDELNVNYDKNKISARLLQLLSGCREVVDLCCGTGDVAIALAKHGKNIIGIDISEDMLNVATEKAMQNAARVLFLVGDAREFVLQKKADAVYSLTDGMNYMLSDADIKKAFEAVNNALKPGGRFIFDMSTVYKYENILKNNAFTFDFEDMYVGWQNDYNFDTEICEMNITCFTKKVKNKYERFDEVHYQKAYTVNQIERMLEETGFELRNVFSGYDDVPLNELSERMLIVAVKKEN